MKLSIALLGQTSYFEKFVSILFIMILNKKVIEEKWILNIKFNLCDPQ